MAPSAIKQEMLMVAHVTDLPSAADQTEASQVEAEPLATDELLVEEVSIDGMCGVY
jgi:mycofactocin precursor